MATYRILPCTITDAAELSLNKISAFWEDPNWVLSWRHTTLEKHIDKTTKRYPSRLINDRETSRHQRAVDLETGQLVGFARWMIPTSYVASGKTAWPEAVVAAVALEEEAGIRRIAAATLWNPNDDQSC